MCSLAKVRAQQTLNPGLDSQCCTNLTRWYIHVMPALGRGRREDQRLKVTLGYIVKLTKTRSILNTVRFLTVPLNN